MRKRARARQPAGPMRPVSRHSVAVGPASMLLATLVGAWLGHALEYVRVWGTSGFGGVVSRSLHAYMGPVGLVLIVAGAVATGSTSLLAHKLEVRLARLRRGLWARPTGHGRDLRSSSRAPAVVGFSTLAASLWLAQVPIYFVQENVEARVAHIPSPGLGALTGRHALAPLVHLAVAMTVAGVLYLTRRRVTQLAVEVRRAVALLAGLRRPPRTLVVPRHSSRWWTPAELWGKQSWSRPPPALA